MKRYIDADAIMEEMDRYIEQHFTKLGMVIDGNDCFYKIRELLANAPTADVVEVVRCKDCGNRTELPYVDKDTYEPIYDCGYNISAIWGEENGYCSHGKRRG